MDIKRLIKACQENKRLAQKELVAHIAPKLKGLCLRYLNDEFEVEEALQESLIKILKSINKYQLDKDSFFPWIKKITINTIFSRLKSQMRNPEMLRLETFANKEVPPSVYDQLYSEDLLELIHSLPLGYRTVLCLYAIDGYSHKEIAELLGINESSSRSQLTRARSLLKQKIISQKKDVRWKEIA
ncbi:MAG: sigma-70 family RNA polymerase sigma factor [Bacteroidota bacterium]